MAMRTGFETGNAAGDETFPAQLRIVEKAIRRIVRAHDLQSRALARRSGLTAVQLVLLKGIAALGEVSSARLSAHADISAATLVIVLDNLEERGLIERYRSHADRRIVHARLTARGRAMVEAAPEPLGDAFTQRFAALSPQARARLGRSLLELADMLSGPEPSSGG